MCHYVINTVECGIPVWLVFDRSLEHLGTLLDGPKKNWPSALSPSSLELSGKAAERRPYGWRYVA